MCPDPDTDTAAARRRRVPQQERSRATLERVLAAADVVLARDGSDGLSTSAVAREAGVAVGSVYAYLPDKEAIAEALAVRYWGAFAYAVRALADAATPPARPIDAVLDALADAFRERPGFRALWFGGLRTEEVRAVTRPLRDEVARDVERLLAADRPSAAAADRRAAAATLVLIGDGLLREAFRRNPAGDPAVLAEGRIALAAYADARLGPA
jgi:AcrR family transcriptional regulator